MLVAARSERYHHLETEEDDTNDEDFNVELRQFSSCSHRFSKVPPVSSRTPPPDDVCQSLPVSTPTLLSRERRHVQSLFHMEMCVSNGPPPPPQLPPAALNIDFSFAYIFHLQISSFI